jgi:8-oxo-dGTP diphosphatase
VILAQKAVIKDGDRFLVLLRSKDEKAFPNLWDFPGGKWELGENHHESLIREVFEETGLTIDPEKTPCNTSSAQVQPGVLVEFRIYSVNSYSGSVHIGKEHAAYRWATKKEILALNTMPYMRNFLENLT